jgi:hypothetical protein
MIQVTVINNKTGLMGWGSQFPDQPTANAWIAECIANNWWGKPARTVTPNPQGVLVDFDGAILDPSRAASINTIIVKPGYPGVVPSYQGVPKGGQSQITVVANSPGIVHSANIFCDGVSTLNAILNSWNQTNLANPLTLLKGDGSQVFAACTIAVSNGQDPIPAVTTQTFNFAAEYLITSTVI